jgi:hypothetical protein
MATFEPIAPSRRATARPMPRLPPVISEICPASGKSVPIEISLLFLRLKFDERVTWFEQKAS